MKISQKASSAFKKHRPSRYFWVLGIRSPEAEAAMQNELRRERRGKHTRASESAAGERSLTKRGTFNESLTE